VYRTGALCFLLFIAETVPDFGAILGQIFYRNELALHVSSFDLNAGKYENTNDKKFEIILNKR
jgi:hypothetical protein